MFTGIIQAIGQVSEIQHFNSDVRIEINAHTLPLQDVKIGDSIAVNGACLTVVSLWPPYFQVDVSAHTLQKTTLGNIRIGHQVNLEKCLQLNSYLGGHLVTGHVDGIARLLAKHEVARAWELIWQVPQDLLGYIAVKGSIALNGISLTVNSVEDDQVGVTVIPHTQENTTLHALKLGTEVNVEIDLVARYVARWLEAAPEKIDYNPKWSQLLGNL